jgi:hypothetical protein
MAHQLNSTVISTTLNTPLFLQETKCANFDWSLVRKFYPKRFDNFIFSSSVWEVRGLIIYWNSLVFVGQVVEVHRYGIESPIDVSPQLYVFDFDVVD